MNPQNQKLDWRILAFSELTLEQLYQILRLRSEVFIVEQNCLFQDMDNKDQKCVHVLGYRNGELLAVTRIVPPGVSYEYASIGRVAVSAKGRGQGLGIELMEVSILELERLHGKVAIRIGAQLYLKKFYGSFGFRQTSEIYLEDGIQHIEMTRNAEYSA